MMNCDLQLVITMIDEYLVQAGSQSLLDGDKVRDMLLDLRSMCNAMTIPEIVPVPLVVDPAPFGF